MEDRTIKTFTLQGLTTELHTFPKLWQAKQYSFSNPVFSVSSTNLFKNSTLFSLLPCLSIKNTVNKTWQDLVSLKCTINTENTHDFHLKKKCYGAFYFQRKWKQNHFFIKGLLIMNSVEGYRSLSYSNWG